MEESIQLERERAMLRFSLREMMMLTLIVGLLIGWWMQYRRAEALHVKNVLLSGIKRDLGVANDQTAFYERIVDAYRRQGYHYSHAPEGTITILHDAGTVGYAEHGSPRIITNPIGEN